MEPDGFASISDAQWSAELAVRGGLAMSTTKSRQELAQKKLAECSRVVGEAFFPFMVEALAQALEVRWVLLCALHPVDPRKARTVAVWDDGPGANFEYDLAGTPCANIVDSGTCAYVSGVAEAFPEDIMLKEMRAESYVGAPLRSATGEVLGLLAVLDTKPFDDAQLASEMVEVFAARAAAEIERVSAASINERLGRVVEDSVSEVYVFSAETYKFELVNRGARENLGYSMAELRELAPWDLKPEFSAAAFAQMVEPLRNGKQRYLEFETIHRRKDGTHYDVSVRLQLLPGLDNVFYAAIEDITSRNQASRALRETTQRLNAIINNTRMAVFMMDDRQHCVFMNPAAEKLTGYGMVEVAGRPLHDVIHHTYPDGRPFPIAECAIDRAFPEDNQVEGEEVFVHKDGSFYPVAFTASPIRNESGKPIGTIIEARHIAEELRAREALSAFNETLQRRVAEAIEGRRKVEMQLAQAQKMEAIGKLTGGVAHDFNNLLQVIRGNLEFLVRDVAGNERAARRVHNALTGVERGAKLASQLLAFGRRQPLESRPLNLGRVLLELDDMLQRALGEGVELETVVAGGLWNCLADPTQVENAILNLAINARDAMSGRGKLTIEAGNASLDDEYIAQHSDVSPGQYVMIAVTDTGCGIPADQLEHVFEPFFSTKPEGEGTGLGLSMVYGFVKQSGGHVKIYSEVGHGTTVRLYLPRTRRPDEVVSDSASGEVAGGVETVLLVEDDDGVRATATDMLIELGYKVLQAKDADSALAIVESGATIDLLFTDVVMPGVLKSTELADRFRRRFERGAVLYTSGYTQNSIVHAGRLDDGVELLCKPYSREALARKVRQVLDGRSRLCDPPASIGKAENPGRGCQRTVLLVEDEALIRLNTADMLADLNFSVVEAATGQEACALLAERKFDVLLTDLALPDASGLDVARAALTQNADIKIVFASGQIMPTPSDVRGATWLSKPYDHQALAAAVGVVLKRAE
jgi:PAS domain S-box-containing protein